MALFDFFGFPEARLLANGISRALPATMLSLMCCKEEGSKELLWMNFIFIPAWLCRGVTADFEIKNKKKKK
ncbi:hypothetical protein XalbCFBP2523_03555 [Xanthomonas albilineans]|nr:hypothetical protein XalbCFBP2523_03555 [Xanthomonas albilineans]